LDDKTKELLKISSEYSSIIIQNKDLSAYTHWFESIQLPTSNIIKDKIESDTLLFSTLFFFIKGLQKIYAYFL
jgi:hypothetical protein